MSLSCQYAFRNRRFLRETLLRIAPVLGLVALLPAAVFAVRTESVEHQSFEDFLGGDFRNVALSSSGALILAPEAEELAGPDEPIIWSAVSDSNGGFFFGTGNRGKVFHLSADGELRTVFEPEQVLSRSLALAPDGTLFVGTSPEGRVYRIRDDEKPEVFFEPEQNYIWDIVLNDQGDMYVATGAQGHIYRLAHDHEPGEAVELFFESDQTHISTLAWDGEGRLLAGTSPGGFVYRLDAEGNAFAILNTGDNEIKRIVTAEDGALYVATFTEESGGSAPPARPTGAIANVIQALIGSGENDNSSNNARQQAQRATAQARISMIYRVDPDGFAEPHWVLPGHAIHSMILLPDGRLLVGMGNDGRVFSVSDATDWQLLQRLESGGEVSVLLPGSAKDGEVYALSSNPSRIYRMDFSLAAKGHYTSEVLDMERGSHWGRFHLDGAGDGIRVSTRSGNTDEPERTWSDWTDPANAGEANAIGSPAARYIQYRVYLESDGGSNPLPRVNRTRLFYRNFNASPAITGIRLVPAEVALERVPASPQAPSIDLDQLFNSNRVRSSNAQQRTGQLRAVERPGLATIAWQARDPNDDDLSFTLRIRSEDEERWTTLAEDLRDNFFSFNTRGFDEGRYYAKVIASDHLSNPPGEARTASRTSEAFLIDNTSPTVELLEKNVGNASAVLRVAVEDRVSIIKDVRYYLNGGDRTPIFPEDGLFDSRRETFRLELNDLEPGAHSVIVAAEDEAGNERVLNIHFEVD